MYKKMKRILTILCLFIGIGAVYGSIAMFIDPTGKLLQMDNLLKYFEVLPFSDKLFQDYIFSGISLLIVNGITNLIAVYLLIKNRKSGIVLGCIFGITLMLWITIQFIILPKNILSTTYFILGLIQTIIGYITYVLYMQNKFKFDIDKYKNIGKNKDNIVVYFSRLGYTKKIAYEVSNELGCDILEIKTKYKINTVSGFWWCGRFGMHKWDMEIKNIDIDLKKYNKVILVSPIWVFSVSAPIRCFIHKYKNEINNVEYIFTHFMNVSFKKVADELDKILDKKRQKFTSICVRFGEIRNVKNM